VKYDTTADSKNPTIIDNWNNLFTEELKNEIKLLRSKIFISLQDEPGPDPPMQRWSLFSVCT
jgi:hypothetical protein